jgi:hypothetical protein
MSKVNIMSQIYRYIICLVTVLVFLFGLPNFVKAIINITDIEYARGAPSVLTEPYEKWKFYFVNNLRYEDYDRSLSEVSDKEKAKNIVEIPEESELMKIF